MLPRQGAPAAARRSASTTIHHTPGPRTTTAQPAVESRSAGDLLPPGRDVPCQTVKPRMPAQTSTPRPSDAAGPRSRFGSGLQAPVTARLTVRVVRAVSFAAARPLRGSVATDRTLSCAGVFGWTRSRNRPHFGSRTPASSNWCGGSFIGSYNRSRWATGGQTSEIPGLAGPAGPI